MCECVECLSLSLSPSPRLLALAVKLLREKPLTNPVERTLLREKIYNTILDFFWWVGSKVMSVA